MCCWLPHLRVIKPSATGTVYEANGGTSAGSVDSFDGDCLGDHSRWTRIGAARRYSSDYNIFRQSLRGMFFAAVVFGLYWSRGSSTAVLASMAAGIMTLIVWLIAGYNTLLRSLSALAVSVAVYVACALGHSRRVDLDRLLASD